MKKNWLKKFLACSLCLAMLVGLLPAVAAVNPAKAVANILDEMTVSEAAAETIAPEEWVTVIVELDGDTTLDVDEFVSMFRSNSVGYSTDATVAAYRADMVDVQNDLQVQINAINNKATFKYHYTNLLNGFAAKVQYKDIEAIKSLAGVADVYMTQTYTALDTVEEEMTPFSAESLYSDTGSVNQMGLQTAWDAGYTGAGKIVGVFDSSLRYTHDMFQYMDPDVKAAGEAGNLSNYMTQERLLNTVTANQDSLNLFVSDWGCWFHGWAEEGNDHATGFSEEMQAQFLKGVFGTDARNKDKVPFAVDYSCGDMDVWDGDSGSHGTHVSGIAAGNAGPDNPITTVNKILGGAYDAQIMFFKVFCEDDPNGQECDEAVFAALDDAVTLGVNAFNLSLGIPNGFTTMNTYAQAGYQKAYNRAAAAGIAVCVSAGNDARDSHSGALVSGYTTVLPNSSKVGFSGDLYSPMTVASAQGTGYITTTNTTVATVTVNDVATDYSLADNNSTMVGAALNGTYTNENLVAVGAGSREEILAATGATALEGALTGKIALVQRGGSTSDYTKIENVAEAGAIGLIIGNTTDSNSAISYWYLVDELPTFGYMKSSGYTALVDALKAGTAVSISFASSAVATNREYPDSGPSSFTSWGVSESLDMKPDIMAPGGSIYSTGAGSDTALSSKSGTSMASPNAEGAFILIQQYVDDNLDVFGVEPGTIEYNCLVNQLAASTAIPYIDSSNHYFSPRRQGAGMLNVANAMNSYVVLSNDVAYDAATGNAPRAKVNLGDKVGNTFDITFNLTNYGESPVIYDVAAVLQTDSTTTSAGREILAGGAACTGDPLPGTMKVTNITAGGVMLRDSENINAYTEGTTAARIVVDSETAVKVTVSVTLDAEAMAAFDAKYPNGMFVEGFMTLTGINGAQNVGLPFMGFRGDFNQAPIFDMATAYDDISEKALTDLDYPLYHTDTVNTIAGQSMAVLGANQYTGAALPEYYQTSSTARIRSYLDTLRTNGGLSADFAAISPNGDSYNDIVFAALFQLRNAKAVVVTVTDAEGNVVKTMGPEYEYFESLTSDGNCTQQAMMTYGTKYNRNMAWDGTDAEGKVVADGQYNYNVYAITEYDYLNNLGYGADDAAVADYVLSSETAHKQSFAVKVDTQAPALTTSTDGTTVTVEVSDNVAVQAVNCYYDGAPVGTAVQVNAATGTATFQLEEGTDMSKVTVQAVDYAMNVTTATVALPELTIVEQPTDYEGKMGENAAFSVTVNRADVTYQWYYSKNGGKSWGESTLTGADTATVTVPMKSDRVNQMYKCVVTDSEGNSVETVVVTMTTATEGLAIVTNPADYTGAVNEMATFTVEATGEGLSYQWMYSNNGGLTYVKSTAPTATTASVSIAVKAFRDGQMYKCVVTDASGNVVESAPATMTVSK